MKINVWENPAVYASTRDFSSLYGTMLSESENGEIAAQLSLPA